jgi:glycosyltransferase involved in cell wall biosynthesis
MMHILFLTDSFPPEVNAPASRTFEHCREWVQGGHQVTIITCVPNFPKGVVYPGYRNKLWSFEDIEGIRVVRVWSYIARNEGFAKRVFDYMSYMLTAFIAGLFIRKVDIIVGTSPQFFTVCAAYALSVFKRCPWVFELRDLWPESIRAVGAMKRSWFLDRLEDLELFLYRNSNGIITVTKSFRNNLIERGIEPHKIHVVTNGVDISRFHPMPKDRALLMQHGLDGKFVAGYIGTHGMAHALDTLIESAEMLLNSDRGRGIHIIMLGDGAQRSQLKAKADSKGLSNIQFIESVPKDEVVRYWSLLDVAIVHLRKSDLFETVIPSKIFECAGMGIPILHGVRGESADLVQEHEIGWTFEPENASMLAQKLCMVRERPKELRRLALNGPRAGRAFDRKVLAGVMLDILECIATRDGKSSL